MSDTAVPTDAPHSDLTEKPACFYLGRKYDLDAKRVVPGPEGILEYDARNLTTHGVIVGMTGSGKTGLSIALLEEAAIDAIPAVIIDPKGGLTNLLLQFPEMRPEDFAAWLKEDDIPRDPDQRKPSKKEYSQRLAERWKKGLADSDQSPERIKYRRQATDYRIYTPGSETGLPVSVLGSLERPRKNLPAEVLAEKIESTANALLGLAGIEGGDTQSRELVLVGQLLQHAWKQGRDLDLPSLIKEIQTPPIKTIGTYNVETFYPAKERLKFASQLNGFLASPALATWTMGEPLDFDRLLWRDNKPQHVIFSIAHLDDHQRMFFVTLLLEEFLTWTRMQTGTTQLRALLYFDELFGYLPPYPKSPPSKRPLLTLLKQARAFGVGVLLATQNPIDLDYKALSNAGTWFVGKLQTDRDRARLLEGLESAAADRGAATDVRSVDRVLASLSNRVFLYHHISDNTPTIFQSKWCLSYLRGPLSRDEISVLMADVKRKDEMQRGGALVARPACPHCGAVLDFGVADRCQGCGKNPMQPPDGGTVPVAVAAVAAVAAPGAPAVAGGGVNHHSSVQYTHPVLPGDVKQYYLPVSGSKPGFELEYQPWLLGFAEVVFQVDKRSGSEHKMTVRLLARAPAPSHPVDWDKAMPLGIDPVVTPQDRARWAAVPDTIDTGRKLKALEKAFGEHVYGSLKLSLYENRELEMVSAPGETQAAFTARCKKTADQARDRAQELEKIKFAPKITAAGQKSKGAEDAVKRLEADLESKQAEWTEKYRSAAAAVTAVQLKPRKADVRVTHFGIAWAPFWQAR